MRRLPLIALGDMKRCLYSSQRFEIKVPQDRSATESAAEGRGSF